MSDRKSPTDPVDALTRLTEAEVAGVEWSPQELQEDRPLRFFVSYAHTDQKLKADLIERLQVQLDTHPAFQFELWSDGEILLGVDWCESIQRAMEACDFGLLLVSPNFLSRKFIKNHELPYLLKNKPIIPIAVRKLIMDGGADLLGLEKKQIFCHQNASFIEKTTEKTKDDFAIELYKKISEGLKAAPTKPKLPDHFRLSIEDFDPASFVPPEGIESTLHKGIDPVPALDTKLRKNALQFLTEWIEDPQGPPYCALLGETGMGKTTTCKAFAQNLLERRDQSGPVPLPIYLDLRHVGGSGKSLVLEEILALILKRSWRGGPRQTQLTASDVLDLVTAQKTLVIWDGLDEVLVHLTDSDGQLFTRQLFRILPPAPRNRRRPGHMLITCRTHYFRTLRDQQTHLRGEDRDNIREQDYRAPFLLLPFTPAQIRQYIQATLPNENPDRVMEVLASVHNLTEMAERPYTLSLIVQQFAAIERAKAEGRRVTGLTLYRHLVLSWLERDRGKHQLTPDHKQALMEHFAAALWRSGQRYWTVSNVEQWLVDFLVQHPEMAAHYHGIGREQLKEDLRTATFLVREGEDRFRFAHTSLQEFFLAGYLRRALVENEPGRWAIAQVSRETIDFLGQWLEEDEGRQTALATLGRIRDVYHPQASELALAYSLAAHSKRYPVPSLSGFQLPGADLTGWEFAGLVLDGINLSGARLWNTCWRNCQMSGAILTNADASRAEFLNCRMPDSNWSSAVLEAAVFRDCDLSRAAFHDARPRKAQWLRCDLVDSKGMPQALPAVLLALNRPPSPTTPNEERRETWVGNGHSGSVRACAWSPDGIRIASASEDNMLRIWDAESGQSLHTLTGHKDSVSACAWSPDGTRIVSASLDKTLRIWNAKSGRCLRTLIGHKHSVSGCSWSPNGTRIVSGSDDDTLRIWDTESGQCQRALTGHEADVNGCAWSPDGTRIVSASDDQTLRIWGAESGQRLRTLSGHLGRVSGCAWSPDGTRIVSASRDGTLRIWDAQSGQCICTLAGHENSPNSCAWSPDGTRIVSSSVDHTLRIWDSESGQSLRVPTGHGMVVNGCAWSPDGRRIVSASADRTLRIWDAASGQGLCTLTGQEVSGYGCAWSPDRTQIVSASDDKMLRIWDAASGQCLRTMIGHEAMVRSGAWSPNGRQIVSASWDTTLRIWDAQSGQNTAVSTGHEDFVWNCEWSPDGTLFVSASRDKTLRIWNAESGACLRTLTGHEHYVYGCAWSPDGTRVVSASADKTLRIWDSKSGQSLLTLAGHEDFVYGCAWSPDGRRIVSASEDDTLRIWDAKSGQCLRTLIGHEDFVASCGWSPDSTRIVSASDDKTLRIWDAEPGECTLILTGHQATVRSCAWQREGRFIVSSARDGTLRIWDAETGAELPRRIYFRRTPNGTTWATIDPVNNRILACHPEAWRILGWHVPGPDGFGLILPAETYGPLPIQEPAER
jgi:WD40 repeat protein